MKCWQRIVSPGGLVLAIASPDNKEYVVGDGVISSIRTVLVAVREAIRTGIAIYTISAGEVAGRHGDGVATVVGVVVAVGVEDFDGTVYDGAAAVEQLAHFLGFRNRVFELCVVTVLLKRLNGWVYWCDRTPSTLQKQGNREDSLKVSA